MWKDPTQTAFLKEAVSRTDRPSESHGFLSSHDGLKMIMMLYITVNIAVSGRNQSSGKMYT